MRKVIFKIDDKEYFRRELEKDNCTGKQAEDILKGLGDFKAIYTIYGNGNNADRYTLTDHNGNRIDINSLNGYEYGVVLGDCHAYFESGKYHSNTKKPCGVVKIIEEEI